MAPNYGPDRGYYHAMDRDYNPDAVMPLRQIGVSIMATKDAIQPLVAKIREGASKVEIGFMGAGKGSVFSGQITPESVDSEQRQAIRELAKINKVDLSTHATVSTGGFAGLSQRGFDENTRMQNVNEIKRAIEFAADTAQGGAITIHTDEFPRPIFNVSPKEEGLFRAHPSEAEEAQFYLVDTRTGDIITAVRKNVPIQMPEWEKDENGTIRKDTFGNPVPKYDVKARKFVLKEVGWDEVVKLTNEWNKDHPKETLAPEQMYYKQLVDSKRLQAEGERLYHMQGYDRLVESKRHMENALVLYKKLETAAGEGKEHLKKELRTEMDAAGLVPSEEKLPSEILKQELDQINHQLSRIQHAALSYQEQQKDYEETLKRIKPIKEVAIDKSADSMARAGAYAYQLEQEKGLNKDGKRPLFVAPENLFPERYGSHPQELKEVIISARNKMAEMLIKQGKGSSEAAKIAGDHIKATLDIGHLNTWRKYFESKPGETIAAANERFKGWILNQMEDLNKHKIIGHLHITDNFGYHDEHLTPGMGSAPIKEFVELMKKAGITDMVVEPGAQDPSKQYEALYGGWKLFGHSIYGLSAPGAKRLDWGDVQQSYFGKNNPPYFLFGDLALSEEYRGSPFWSGLGLE